MSTSSDAALDTKLNELEALGRDLVQRATAQGATLAECVIRTGRELSAKVRLGEVELLEEAGHHGVGLRVMRGQRVASATTSDLRPSALDAFVREVVGLAEWTEEDAFAGPADSALLCDPSALADLNLYDPSGDTLGAKDGILRATRTEQFARGKDTRISNSDGATFSHATGGSITVLSSGFVAKHKGSSFGLGVSVLAEDEGGKKRRGGYGSGKRHLSDLETEHFVGEEAARRTLRKLGARGAATGEYPVVFDRDAARSLLGQLSGCVMGGSVWRKSSYLAGREGTRIGSELLNIVDDPLLMRGPGSRSHDGEGLASRKNVVVENGVLRTYLCDSYSARKLGRASTASASRGGSGGVSASTTNFYLKPGTDSFEALVKATPRGLLVTDMMGFGFNAVTGDFSRGASGFWIENGEIAYPVSEVTVSLNFNELWDRIDAIASDLQHDSSIASPGFRVGRMTVAGKAE